MIIFLLIFVGAVVGFFSNQLVKDQTARLHIDIIAGAVGAPVGLVIGNVVFGNNPTDKIYTLVISLFVAFLAIIASRFMKL